MKGLLIFQLAVYPVYAGQPPPPADFSDLPSRLMEQLEQAQKSVWMIVGGHKSRGTAFFVSPHHVVTNWHVISDSDISSLSLQREGSRRKLLIKRPVSISLLYDLALLETEKASTSYLTVGKDPASSEEKLVLLGYPAGIFRYIFKTSLFEKFQGNDNLKSYFVNRVELSGVSGGPVLSATGEALGVAVSAASNHMSMIKGSVLRKFIDGDIGLSCEGWGLKACVREEMNSLRERAERGSRTAQNQLAVMYDEGIGVPRNLSEALYWLRRSAERGYARAQYKLGAMYKRGEGVPRNLPTAVYWHRRSAERGYAPAQYSLGVMYEGRERVPRNLPEALYWLRRSAERGYAPSQYSLGGMYYKGEGVPQDSSTAVYWTRLSAERDYAPAQYSLGGMYYKGEGVPRNLPEALYWTRRSAVQGDALAQYELRVMYEEELGDQKDLTLASKRLRRSAEQGNVSAGLKTAAALEQTRREASSRCRKVFE